MRVLLADDEARVRMALRLLLEQEGQMEIAGEAEDVDGLLRETQVGQVDLILLDWELPGLRADRLFPLLRLATPKRSIVAMSGQPQARAEALASGADGFISKVDPAERVLSVIYEVLGRGGSQNFGVDR